MNKAVVLKVLGGISVLFGIGTLLVGSLWITSGLSSVPVGAALPAIVVAYVLGPLAVLVGGLVVYWGIQLARDWGGRSPLLLYFGLLTVGTLVAAVYGALDLWDASHSGATAAFTRTGQKALIPLAMFVLLWSRWGRGGGRA